jgi:hypothetical protein
MFQICVRGDWAKEQAAAIDLKLTNVSAKNESATCQWLGAAIYAAAL